MLLHSIVSETTEERSVLDRHETPVTLMIEPSRPRSLIRPTACCDSGQNASCSASVRCLERVRCFARNLEPKRSHVQQSLEARADVHNTKETTHNWEETEIQGKAQECTCAQAQVRD